MTTKRYELPVYADAIVEVDLPDNWESMDLEEKKNYIADNHKIIGMHPEETRDVWWDSSDYPDTCSAAISDNRLELYKDSMFTKEASKGD